jgi:hypothetical protein
MNFLAAAVQLVLRMLESFASVQKLLLYKEWAFARRPEGISVFALCRGLVADLLMDLLKFDNILGLFRLNFQKRQNDAADVGGFVGCYAPNVLWAVLGSIFVHYPSCHQVAPEGLPQKCSRFRLTHRNCDESAVCPASWTARNDHRSLSINDSSRIRKVHSRDSVEAGQLRHFFFGYSGLVARKPFLIAALRCFLDLFWGKFEAGHLISFIDRCSWLVRCGNTTSAFLYSTPELQAVAS